VAQVISAKAEVKKLEDLTGTGQNLGLLVSVMIVCLGAIGVMAMMVTRFDAMSTQLAVLRAMGYEKKEIRSWLLWEGTLLGLGACAVGALLDLITFPIVRNLLGSALPPSEFVSIPIWQSSPVWIAATIGTISAIFIPLYRLYHQDVHSALRA
jgi:putative ABC transport system permease protein